MESTLPNLSEFKDLTHLPYFLAAMLIVDTVVILLTRYFPDKVGGESVNDWFDKFGLEGVAANIFIFLALFVIAQYVYSTYISPGYGWNPLLFVALLVGVQLVYDVVFYNGVIRQLPVGLNEMVDTCNKYGVENGGLTLLGGATVAIGSTGLTFALESMPPYVATFITILTLYAIPWALNTKMQGPYRYKAPEPVKPKEEVKQEPPPRQSTPWDMLKPQVQSTTPDQVDRKNFMMQGQGQAQGQQMNDFSPYSLL